MEESPASNNLRKRRKKGNRFFVSANAYSVMKLKLRKTK